MAACGGLASAPAAEDAGATSAEGGADDVVAASEGGDGTSTGVCPLFADTTATATTDGRGCHVLARDTSACRAAREAQGLSGVWLRFSCRVTLTATPSAVEAKADGQPDYGSFYFTKTSPCYEPWPEGSPNPNVIVAQSYTMEFPLAPDTTSQAMPLGAVGLSIDGVAIYSNVAAPGDDIYLEARTFDRCAGHPDPRGHYHFHTEPTAITFDDASFVGVLRDGYPVYGRKDADGSYPSSLDAYGGHAAVTADSPTTAVYHYHVNQQASTSPGSAGQTAWFLTTGTFRGTPGACTGCM